MFWDIFRKNKLFLTKNDKFPFFMNRMFIRFKPYVHTVLKISTSVRGWSELKIILKNTKKTYDVQHDALPDHSPTRATICMKSGTTYCATGSYARIGIVSRINYYSDLNLTESREIVSNIWTIRNTYLFQENFYPLESI